MFEKPNIDRNALFCDETEDFRCPSEANAGDTVTFRFRTGRGNVDRVLLVLSLIHISDADPGFQDSQIQSWQGFKRRCQQLIEESLYETGQVFEGIPPDQEADGGQRGL